MPEPARKIGEIKVTVTVQKRREERARALRELRKKDRRRLAEHVTSPHMAGIGAPSQPRAEGQPAGKPAGAQPEIAPEGAPTEGKAPEEGKPDEGKEGAPQEEAPKEPEAEPEKPEAETPEDRKRALDEQRQKDKEEKEKSKEEEGKKDKEKEEGEKGKEGEPPSRMGGALKRLKEAQKKRAAAKAAGEKVEGMAWKELYELVNGAGTVSLFGIILVIFVVHVQIWAEFFSLDIEMIPPFEIPIFGDMFPTPLWMKMTAMFFFDFMLLVAVIGTLAPIFIPIGWVAKLFGWIIQ